MDPTDIITEKDTIIGVGTSAIETKQTVISNHLFTYKNNTGFYHTQTGICTRDPSLLVKDVEETNLNDKFVEILDALASMDKCNCEIIINRINNKTWVLQLINKDFKKLLSFKLLLTNLKDTCMFDITISNEYLIIRDKEMTMNMLLSNIKNIELLIGIKQKLDKAKYCDNLLKNIIDDCTYLQKSLLSYVLTSGDDNIIITMSTFDICTLHINYGRANSKLIAQYLQLGNKLNKCREEKRAHDRTIFKMQEDIKIHKGELAAKEKELDDMLKICNRIGLQDSSICLEIQALRSKEGEILENERYCQNFGKCLDQIKSNTIQLKKVKLEPSGLLRRPEVKQEPEVKLEQEVKLELEPEPKLEPSGLLHRPEPVTNIADPELVELINYLNSHKQITSEAMIMDLDTFFAINNNLTSKQQENYVKYYTLDDSQKEYVNSKLSQ